jgi:hypothetical protein
LRLNKHPVSGRDFSNHQQYPTLSASRNERSSAYICISPSNVPTIHTGAAYQQNSRPDAQNFEQRTAAEQKIGTLLRAKQIRLSVSPWPSPMLFARKKENTLQRVGEHRFFTKRDLASGYLQTLIREVNRTTTTFTTGTSL